MKDFSFNRKNSAERAENAVTNGSGRQKTLPSVHRLRLFPARSLWTWGIVARKWGEPKYSRI